MTSILPIVIPLVLILAYGIRVYNRLVHLSNLRDEAWSGIDVQLKRRHNLIPNLVEIVKGYMGHERSTLEEVTKLRSQSESTEQVAETGRIEQQLGQGLKHIFALAEAYPDLKASEGFLKLQHNLVEIEDQLHYARRYYNGTVRNLNIAVLSFPSNVIAKYAGYKPADFFEIEYATERQAPEVKI